MYRYMCHKTPKLLATCDYNTGTVLKMCFNMKFFNWWIDAIKQSKGVQQEVNILNWDLFQFATHTMLWLEMGVYIRYIIYWYQILIILSLNHNYEAIFSTGKQLMKHNDFLLLPQLQRKYQHIFELFMYLHGLGGLGFFC